MTSTSSANELGDECGKPLGFPSAQRYSMTSVLALDVAELAQPLPEALRSGCVDWVRRQSPRTPIAVDLPRLLRPGGERRGEGTGQRGQQEAAAVHYSIT